MPMQAYKAQLPSGLPFDAVMKEVKMCEQKVVMLAGMTSSRVAVQSQPSVRQMAAAVTGEVIILIS